MGVDIIAQTEANIYKHTHTNTYKSIVSKQVSAVSEPREFSFGGCQ